MTKMNSTYWSILIISGPIPGEFSLLSIGACIVSNPAISIYLELNLLAQNMT